MHFVPAIAIFSFRVLKGHDLIYRKFVLGQNFFFFFTVFHHFGTVPSEKLSIAKSITEVCLRVY